MKNLAKSTKTKLKVFNDPIDLSSTEKIIAKMERPKDLERAKSLKNINKHANINLNDVNNLIDEINSNIIEGDNIVDLGDNKKVNFRDLTNSLSDIKDGKISDFNKKREYRE